MLLFKLVCVTAYNKLRGIFPFGSKRGRVKSGRTAGMQTVICNFFTKIYLLQIKTPGLLSLAGAFL